MKQSYALPWEKWSGLIERVRLIQTLIGGGKNELQRRTRTDHHFLRETEVALSQGETIGRVCRRLGVSEQSYYRWRKEYGGLKID
jgi:hypothetical protein